MNERLYTVREAAQYLNVNIQTVYVAIRNNRLKAMKPSKRIIRIPESALQDYLKGGE
jgi:excisionase family DNA binding protein